MIQKITETDSLGSNTINEGSTNIATFCDMIVCYATVSGYNAFRDPEEGSWYVQILCKVLSEDAHDLDFESLLKIICEYMKLKRTERDHLQTPSYENRDFSKYFYFNPGFFG